MSMVRQSSVNQVRKKYKMNDRQRFLNLMNYKPVDRCVYGVRTYPWPETIERWKKEGYDPSQESLFDIDYWEWPFGWFKPNPPFERKVVEEDERTVLCMNSEGILVRELKDNPDSSMPQYVRFPVETREDFRRFAKERLQPDLSLRIWYGIDKRALAQGTAAIDTELQRIRPLIEEGGYVPGLDHSIPPDTPFANYLYYMEHLREIL